MAATNRLPRPTTVVPLFRSLLVPRTIATDLNNLGMLLNSPKTRKPKMTVKLYPSSFPEPSLFSFRILYNLILVAHDKNNSKGYTDLLQIVYDFPYHMLAYVVSATNVKNSFFQAMMRVNKDIQISSLITQHFQTSILVPQGYG
jgi:hypothetical protein